MSKKATGAEVLITCLEKHGVEYIFGYPGGAAIPLFDALARSGTTIKFILNRHEQGAAHAADGYARASGKPGVILVTSGPGAGNIVTGLMTARMDSVPMIAISGQTITAMLGKEAFQEADIVGITKPVTKKNYLVRDGLAIREIVDEAFTIATSGRPGPVLIDLPKDIAAGLVEAAMDIKIVPLPMQETTFQDELIGEIRQCLVRAERPLIMAGHGVLIAGAGAELTQFAEQFEAPVVTTLLGKGAIDETSELSLGMLGMHGTAYANTAIMEADVIVAIGSRFDDRIVGDATVFSEGKKIIHIDIDVTQFGKMIAADIALQADAKKALAALTETGESASHQPWLQRVQALKQQFPLRIDTSAGLTQQAILAAIDQQTKSQAIVTTDVGQHQMWAAQFLRTTTPDHWLSSGGAGTMGFGLPSAIGAQFARPDKTVVAIIGDGGFQMTSYELATAFIHKLPLKIFIMNNHYLGMVRQWQELFYDNTLSGVDMEGNPDFVKLAESYEIRGVNLTDPAEIDEVISDALNYNDGPIVINCEVVKTDNVYPMVPAGAAYDKMLIRAPDTKLEKPSGST